MEIAEQIETTLIDIIVFLRLLLEVISVLCVFLGLIGTTRLAVSLSRRQRVELPFNKIRLRFGTWLAVALEFQLGSDILATTITPTLEDLAKLAAIAVIRTFLNYFLNKELETVSEIEQSRQPYPFQSSE